MTDEMKFFTDGAAYERVMGRWSALAGNKFLDWLSLPRGLRWLDVGCGNGAFTERVIERCAPEEVHALDPSEEQIAYARARPGTRLAQFREGDALALPFGDAAFDAAVMALVIAFVPDPAKAVTEMTRVVRSGGCVATYMWDLMGGGSPFDPIRAALATMGVSPALPPSSAVSRLDAMRGLWKDAGLDVIETRVIEIQLSFQDFADFWQSNTGLPTPATKRIRAMSPAEVERLKAQLRNILVTDAQGRISYVARANAVRGRVPG